MEQTKIHLVMLIVFAFLIRHCQCSTHCPLTRVLQLTPNLAVVPAQVGACNSVYPQRSQQGCRSTVFHLHGAWYGSGALFNSWAGSYRIAPGSYFNLMGVFPTFLSSLLKDNGSCSAIS